MDKIVTNEEWYKKKAKLKHKFATLMDSDLIFDEGKKEEMLQKLMIKLGKTREELLKIIAGL
jgi:hypothetical protein